MSGRKAALIPAALLRDSRLEAGAIRVYGMLALHADRDTNETRIWASTLAEQLGIKRQSVSSQITALKAAGYVQVIAEEGRANRYILTPPESTKDEAGTDIESRPDPQEEPAATRTFNLHPPQEEPAPPPQVKPAQKNHQDKDHQEGPSRPAGRKMAGLPLSGGRSDPADELTEALWHELVRHEHSRRADYRPLVRAALEAGHDPATIRAGARAFTESWRKRHPEAGPSIIQEFAEKGERWIRGEGWISALEAKAERERAQGGDRRLSAEEVEATRRQLAEAAERREAEERAELEGKVVRLPAPGDRREPAKAGGAV